MHPAGPGDPTFAHKIAGNQRLQENFADFLGLAVRIRFQDHRQRGPKAYALHAPEVECIVAGGGWQ
jgi:IS5 family transposase